MPAKSTRTGLRIVREEEAGESNAPSRPSSLRFVALGGGTGLPIILTGLRHELFPGAWPWMSADDRDRITAIVTVADDGGSTGRLRRAYRIPAPGDIRNCLVTLAEDRALAQLFDARFDGNGDVGGHSLGNLILAALNDLEGSFPRAVDRAGDLLRACGRVVPCTTEDVNLVAEFDDGSRVEGEAKIAMVRRRIRRLFIRPEAPRATPPAREAIAAADLVIIGPGSLYTSLLPILLVREIAQEIGRSRARVVLVMNLMTEPGETDGYSASDCIRAIRQHAPEVPIHDVILNDAPMRSDLVLQYARRGSLPLGYEAAAIEALGCRPLIDNLLWDGAGIRHDPHKTGRVILQLARNLAQAGGHRTALTGALDTGAIAP